MISPAISWRDEGHEPMPGERFAILVAGAISGEFLEKLPETLEVSIEYLDDMVVLTAADWMDVGRERADALAAVTCRDLDGDEGVTVTDLFLLLELLGAWGACPRPLNPLIGPGRRPGTQ